MSDYIRRRASGGCIFFTVNLLNRRTHLLTEHIDALRAAFKTVRQSHPFHMDAIVILPEHLHCIWTLPKGDDDYSERWKLIKSEFTRALPATESVSGSRRRKNERGIWQRRFWEHNIRNDIDYERHIDYIHYNPVKHKHVSRPIDWPYSSLHNYVKRGIFDPHWGTSGIIVEDLGIE